MWGCAPLASKSGISDVFSGVLEPFTLPCVCVQMFFMPGQLEPSASSVHDLLLPPGRSGRLGSAGRMLMISQLYLRGFRCYTCMCTCSVYLHGFVG